MPVSLQQARQNRLIVCLELARRMALQGDGEEVILSELKSFMASRWLMSETTRADYLECVRARIEFEKSKTSPPPSK